MLSDNCLCKHIERRTNRNTNFAAKQIKSLFCSFIHSDIYICLCHLNTAFLLYYTLKDMMCQYNYINIIYKL